MEFLRFGSTIPGSYWGCCACCIIQNFKVDPDTKSSIQMVSGDGGTAIVRDGKEMFAGPTYKDIFEQRIRCGTFDLRDMPNHAFLAILTTGQMTTNPGKKWLPILKANGFEFVRTVNNSVWNVNNHIFGLFRNVGPNAVADQFTPPAAWTDLDKTVDEAWEHLDMSGKELTAKIKGQQKVPYDNVGPPKFITEEEVKAAGAPVILAGLRNKYKQQPKEERERLKAQEGIVPTQSLKAVTGL